ncbi:sulfite exporter TauE/SafE family protein [Candidatus Woesearchaeota archaeon]|nr:hypothetical protein [uncultured archaeon]MBS3142062.1 sulfite exporter TauE/SafE family protein [Candidatus Woesearchaeota archaeon]
MESILLIIAFLFSFVTMFIGAISGGVGLVMRPVLIFLGFPAAIVIGTSRVSSLVGDLPSLYLLNKKKRVDWKLVAYLMIPTSIGGVLAGFATLSLFKGWLDLFLGILLLIVAIILFLNKTFGMKEHKSPFSPAYRHIFAFFGTLIISFFGTLTGGLGPLYASLYMWVYGKSYISASALWRFASYIGTCLASIVFIVGGAVDWKLFFALSVGLMLGSYFGTQYGLKKGEEWIRYIVLLVVIGCAVKLIFF